MDEGARNAMIDQYRNGPSELRRAWNAVPDEARHWKPATDAWSAHQIIIHCADSETAAATRIRMLVAEPKPTIIGYEQDAWAARFEYDLLPIDLAFATISAVRRLTTSVILRFTSENWESSGTHSESGPYSAGNWLRIYSAHLHDHADQIRAIVASWRST